MPAKISKSANPLGTRGMVNKVAKNAVYKKNTALGTLNKDLNQTEPTTIKPCEKNTMKHGAHYNKRHSVPLDK